MKFKAWCQTTVGKKCILILVGTVVLATVLFIVDSKSRLPTNEEGKSILYRNGYGEGDTEAEVTAQVEDMEGKEKLNVMIGEQEYAADETEVVLAEAGEKLERYILGENESLDLVRNDLNLISEIPNTSIEVSWETSDYKIMDATGAIQSENLDAGGTLITLTAVLSYNQAQVVEQLSACIYPPLLSDREAVRKSLEHALTQTEETTKSEKAVTLPDEINGKSVTWGQTNQQRCVGILLIGIVMAGLVILAEKENLKTQLKKKRRQMLLDYPEIINQYIVLLSAGLTAKNAWIRMVEEYEKKRETAQKKTEIRYAYEEMMYTMREMQSGRSEAECYERFGKRCELQEYLKFGAMLSQNLKKGSKGLAELLKNEAGNAFEERKNRAKKLGEEASTKLLLPMVLMLLVVFIIIIVPAFLSIQM